jgi:hypothetical protein
MKVLDLLDDPDFVGVVYQCMHAAGDERQPIGDKCFLSREYGAARLQMVLDQNGINLNSFPVYSHSEHYGSGVQK